ncbi:hypothetical protein [Litoribacillus peritrichatus]|uniref:Uncharacterized protein n=1 Tax=Litoribacillus peritrichatus TaxID=718191 RepID=A0ABP7N9V4_9GAMM
MADDNNDKEELTEEQKIQLLEKKNNTLKMFITVLAGISFVLLLGVGTLAYLLADQPDIELATTTETNELKTQLDLQQATIDKMSAQIQLIALQKESASGIPREAAIEAQRDVIHLIKLLQNSMRDESRMIKGARSWYEHYDQLLEALRQKAKDRIIKLGSTPPPESDADQQSPKKNTSSGSKSDDFSEAMF